jgi:hypothetical protein
LPIISACANSKPEAIDLKAIRPTLPAKAHQPCEMIDPSQIETNADASVIFALANGMILQM